MITVHSLTCNYGINPLGFDGQRLRFSWQLDSDRHGTMQTAYRIQVTGPDGFADCIWDSGKVRSDRSVQVDYDGPVLQNRTPYYYRVKVWDNYDRESGWSEAAWWETGNLEESEWVASWIAPEPAILDERTDAVFLLRKLFELKSAAIRSARIYATAAGIYELYLNGAIVSDELFAPGWTSYRHRHQYQTYDVTEQLAAGGNAIGAMLARGWYSGEFSSKRLRGIYGNERCFLMQLHIQYVDGSEEVISTDTTWKASTGAILCSSIYDGESYDARLEKSGWCERDYDDSEWNGTAIRPLPYDQLVPQENWPVRVVQTLRPISVIRTPSGETVLDMGQNMVGRIRISAKLSKGQQIRLAHAEVLDKEGNFYNGNLRSAKQEVLYIANGRGIESYAAHFSFQGFRYVKIDGLSDWDDHALLDSLAGEVIHSDMPVTGQFECSHPLVNQLQSNIVWGQKGNFLDVPTDCPQRDERLGWTGDAQVFASTAAFNFQVAPFFAKWLRDLRADQREDGGVPSVIPNVLVNYKSSIVGTDPHSSAAWGDAATICPWTMYQCYGDEGLLAEQYDSMKAWVNYIRNEGDNEYTWDTGEHFGDWLAMDAEEDSFTGATPKELIATAFYAYSARIVSDAAAVLGKGEEAQQYRKLSNRVAASFRANYMTKFKRLAVPTQTAHVLALMFDLVDLEARKRVSYDLNRLIVENGYRLTTGFVGTPYLCTVLSDNGYHDTAVTLLLQEDHPSWLYAVTKGATTIWEHWDSIKADGSFWSERMNSFNHYAYGAIGDWMYRYLAGLDREGTAAAYKKIRIYPRFANDRLTYAKAELLSPHGLIHSSWSKEGTRIDIQAAVPVNTTAEIILSGARLEQVRLNDNPLIFVEDEGIQSAEQSPSGVIVKAGSGRYRFTYVRSIQ